MEIDSALGTNGYFNRYFAVIFRCLAGIGLLVIFGSPFQSLAQTVELFEEYGKRVKLAERIAPLEDEFLGETVNPYNGSTVFQTTDIDIPGNSALKVQIARRFPIEAKRWTESINGFGNWDVVVPMVEGTFSSLQGWVTSTGGQNRCSNPSAPRTGHGSFEADEVWYGNRMTIPGEPVRELFAGSNPKIPNVQDGRTYYWTTQGFYKVTCLPSTKNGYPGEAFLAISPDGVRYYLDWVVQRDTTSLKKPYLIYQDGAPHSIARKRIFMLATRVEDRFGNWVNYVYSGDKLTRIESNDGRWIDIAYSGQDIASVSTSLGTWTYQYTSKQFQLPSGTSSSFLSDVVQPDGTRWSYALTGVVYPLYERISQPLPSPGTPPDLLLCPPPGSADNEFTFTATHPSGASGAFHFQFMHHYRTRVPKQCSAYQISPSSAYYELRIPNYSGNFSLKTRTITGTGLLPRTWSYYYGWVQSLGFCLSNGKCLETTTCPAGQVCPTTNDSKYVIVTNPDGTKRRSKYGVQYGINEGRLFSEEDLDGSQVKRSVEYAYHTPVASDAAPGSVGSQLGSGNYDPLAHRLFPVASKLTRQDGTNFSLSTKSGCYGAGTLCLDSFGRPQKYERGSTLAGGTSRTEEVVYEDNLFHWVLGQQKKRTCVASVPADIVCDAGVHSVMSETSYDPAWATPAVVKQFGKIVRTLSYDTISSVSSGQLGTVKTIKDGNNNVTTATNWKRGIPQSIVYADGTTQKASVNDHGWITWLDNESNSRTCYDYDGMGRIKEIRYPSEASISTCDQGDGSPGSIWAATTISLAKSISAKYGLPAGHWQQAVKTGNAQKITYFDALWRPVVEESFDNANATATRSLTIKRYDTSGRLAFQSYPLGSLTNYADAGLKGTHTSYDALDRVTHVKQDWEGSGQLTTTTEYLSGFQTRVTNPRTQQATTSYMAWDQPSYDFPVAIVHPAGTFTDIARDAFGKTTQLTRHNADNSTWQRRYFYYDAHQQLCKSKETETGITAYGYDGAGNLAWSASGLPWSSDPACEYTATTAAARRVDRTYDSRNRLQTLAFPDNRGNQAWIYTPDGLPATISTVQAGVTTPTINAYTYNRRRLLTSESQTPYAWETWTLVHSYNANGHLSDTTYPSGLNVAYAPNALGQPTQAGVFATGVTYFPNGAIKQFTYGNGIVHTLTQSIRGLPDTSCDFYGACNASAILNDGYDYDQNGNVAAISDGLAGGRGNRAMTYDGLDRLTQVISPMFGTATYAYDVLDNLTRVTVGATAMAAARDHFYCYDSSWRLTNVKTGSCGGATVTGLGYDVQGNLANKDGVTHEFDYGNRLRNISTGRSYLYDGHGRRVMETIGTMNPQRKRFMYGIDGRLVYESQSSNSNTESIHLGGSLVASRSRPIGTPYPSETITYQHTDALGSPVAVTDAGRAVIERTEYEAYGKPGNRPVRSGVGYTGHVEDTSGLVYMQQRYYDPMIGMFLSVDPIAAYDNPIIQFNRYRYAVNNPYRFTDPDGRQEREHRDWRSITARSPGSAAKMATSARETGGRSGQDQGSASIKYNADPPRTVPPSGDNAKALQCTANCVGADELLVTGGAEQSGHSRSSLHYEDKAVDIVGPPFNSVDHREIMWCARACGYTHGGWEVNSRFYPDGDARSSVYKDHWHFQIGERGRVPLLPNISPGVPISVTKSPTSSGGMIGP